MKNVEIYWINDTKNNVSFYNDTLDDKNLMGSVGGNTPIKLSMDIKTGTTLVIQQVEGNKILISSIVMEVEADG